MHALLDQQSRPEKTEVSPPPLPERKMLTAVDHSQPTSKQEISVVAKPVQAHALLEDAFSMSDASEIDETDETPGHVSLVFVNSVPENSVVYKAQQFTRSPLRRIWDKLCDSYSSLHLKRRQAILFLIYAVTAFTLGFTFYLLGTAPSKKATPTIEPLRLENVILTPIVETPRAKEDSIPSHKAVTVDTKTTEVTAMPATSKQFTNRKTWLRSQTKMKSRKVLRLKKNTPLTVHANFPAPEGWVLAQKSSGDIGFIRTRYLSDKLSPKVRSRY